MNKSVPIEASGIIPVAQSDVAGIPAIALSIPDFEGQAILRIFGNSTQTEIGCYSAVVTNGVTFSHPSSVGTVLGILTFVAIVASIATAVYGDHIPTMRTHYAHSLSVFVVFAVFHHIYYTGALSMNWPSVLVAFWSNYAWSAGMIYSSHMQNSINQLVGSNKGNIGEVGAASSGPSADGIGGGYDITTIYKRSFITHNVFRQWTGTAEDQMHMLWTRSLEKQLPKRALANSTQGYNWYGSPVEPGLPLPGNYSGFAGTLAEEGIPASNAFMTGFLWFVILIAIVSVSMVAFKLVLEGLCKKNLVRTHRLAHFRAHWIRFTCQAVLRTSFIAFFMMMFLTLFQFTFKGSGGVIALAAIAFVTFLTGMYGVAIYACYHRLRNGHYEFRPDRLHFEKTKALGLLPWLGLELDSHRSGKRHQRPSLGSLPFRTVHHINDDPQAIEVHQDEDYVQRFGWLAARFRRTKWWFFSAWLVYEFVRACFYGGAAGHAMTQVFGLLIVECIALILIVYAKPFEGQRLNALVIYILGFSKVATVALSAAFDARFGLARITTTVIGVVIIVIQGLLTIVLMIAIAVGAISSYMSLTRNHESFKPQKWAPIRQRYFDHLEKAATDLPPPPPPIPEEPEAPYFNVGAVRRMTKIEDEGSEKTGDSLYDPFSSRTSVGPVPITPVTVRGSRTNSINRISQIDGSPTTLPFGARPHRASWSIADIANLPDSSARSSRHISSSAGLGASRPPSSSYGVQSKLSDSSLRGAAIRNSHRAVPHPGPLDVRKSRPGTSGLDRKPSVLDERNSEDHDNSVDNSSAGARTDSVGNSMGTPPTVHTGTPATKGSPVVSDEIPGTK